jgi:hypothetical protein
MSDSQGRIGYVNVRKLSTMAKPDLELLVKIETELTQEICNTATGQYLLVICFVLLERLVDDQLLCEIKVPFQADNLGSLRKKSKTAGYWTGR